MQSLAVLAPARLTHDTHLDYFVSDSAIDCHRDHLLVGDRVVKVLSMKEPPSQMFAFLLQDLYEIPGEFVVCLEWQRIPSDRMRRDVQSGRRHFFNKRVSIVNDVSPKTRPEEMLFDDSASATVRQLGDALTKRALLWAVLSRTGAACAEQRGEDTVQIEVPLAVVRTTEARTCWVSPATCDSLHRFRFRADGRPARRPDCVPPHQKRRSAPPGSAAQQSVERPADR